MYYILQIKTHMNITIITILLPYPLTSGGAQAQFNFIDNLRKIHNITVIYPVNAGNNDEALHTLMKKWPEVKFKPYSYFKQLSNAKFLYSKIKRCCNLMFRSSNKEFKKARLLEPYGYDITKSFISFVKDSISEANTDIIQVEFFPYLELCDSLPQDIKKIFIHHEIRYKRNERMMKEFDISVTDLEKMKSLKDKEIEYLNKYDTVVTLTSTDKDILKNDGVKTNIVISPAAIKSKCFSYTDWNHRITFVGGYNHIPNQEGINWFTNEVMPLIHSEITFDLIGKGWSNLDNKSHIQINYCGFVEHLEDVAYGSIMVIPILSGSGMRMKILEGAALCMPIITTSVGIEGLDFKDGESCIIADSAEQFAEQIDILCNNEELRVHIAKNAQQIFNQKYSLANLVQTRNSLYKLEK